MFRDEPRLSIFRSDSRCVPARLAKKSTTPPSDRDRPRQHRVSPDSGAGDGLGKPARDRKLAVLVMPK